MESSTCKTPGNLTLFEMKQMIEDMFPVTVSEVNVQSISILCNKRKSIKLFPVFSHVTSVVTDISVYKIHISV